MIITIDYLILNFKGSFAIKEPDYEVNGRLPFTTVKHEYGNKIFHDVYDLFYRNEKIAIVNACPKSPVLDPDLIQVQFENHLFYTYDLQELREMVNTIENYFDILFEGINRLDVAYDRNDYSDTYINLYVDLIEGKKKLKGREKSVNAYMVTHNGRTEFNGFQIGKRTSNRMLRIYNKTKALQQPKNPKPYIDEYFAKNNITNSDTNPVWRFEYQLNSSFFTYLRENGKNITKQIFDLDALIQLLQKAEKNHFEIVHNTGKTETNKEEQYLLNDWEQIWTDLQAVQSVYVQKITKPWTPSITVQKRLIKGLFRQYYIKDDFKYLDSLTSVINEYNLKDWFYEKYPFYVREFQNKEKLKDRFNEPKFIQRYYALVL